MPILAHIKKKVSYQTQSHYAQVENTKDESIKEKFY